MDSNNYLIRSLYRRCCLWGRKTPIDYGKPYEGGPTPLFCNPQRRFYIAFTITNIIVFLVLILLYIVQFKVYTAPPCVQVDTVFITVIVFAAINALWYIYMARIECASD